MTEAEPSGLYCPECGEEALKYQTEGRGIRFRCNSCNAFKAKDDLLTQSRDKEVEKEENKDKVKEKEKPKKEVKPKKNKDKGLKEDRLKDKNSQYKRKITPQKPGGSRSEDLRILKKVLDDFDVRDKAKNVILSQARRNNGRIQPNELEAMLEDLPSGLNNQRLIGMVGDEYQEELQLLKGKRKDYRRSTRSYQAPQSTTRNNNAVLQLLLEQNQSLMKNLLQDNSSNNGSNQELRREFEEKLEEEKEKRHKAELKAQEKEKEHLKDRLNRLEQKIENTSKEGLSPRERSALVKLLDKKSDQLLGIKSYEVGLDPTKMLYPMQQRPPGREETERTITPSEFVEKVELDEDLITE